MNKNEVFKVEKGDIYLTFVKIKDSTEIRYGKEKVEEVSPSDNFARIWRCDVLYNVGYVERGSWEKTSDIQKRIAEVLEKRGEEVAISTINKEMK